MNLKVLVAAYLLAFSIDCLAQDAANSAVMSEAISAAISVAGSNAAEIQRALDKVPDTQQEGMRFLIENMPERDLKSAKADFLLQNVDLAYKTRESSEWEIPDDIFLNNVLPFASINEKRDEYRKQFRDQFSELVKDAKSPGRAAVILNQKIFQLLNVKYSRKRNRADQGPFESIETGLASCTGLSVLLIDACRSVGVPARFVGTPLWSDKSGNHSWVEVWDDGWHFTGAAEPNGDELDKAWFVQRSSAAKRDEPRHAIYAVSFKKTPIQFPLVWDRSIDYVHAVNVTDRYAGKHDDLPEDHTYAMFQVCGVGGQRKTEPFKVRDKAGKVIFEGFTKDERFDGNDHTTVVLPIGKSFNIELPGGRTESIETKQSKVKEQLFTFAVKKTSNAVDQLEAYLAKESADWDSLTKQKFAQQPLSKSEAKHAAELLTAARRKQLLVERAAEVEAREIVVGEHKLPIFYKVFGEKPAGGRSLFISMHGGGNAPKRVNDRQWENQKRLYEPKEGVYVAPRAPTNTWNLWHEPHVMTLFDRLIEDMVLFEDVNPNRVYLMGYSAGGDGVYQLAPRMADRCAAAAMMAGHPNDAKPQNLRNIGFAIYMGGKDGAYKRNEVAAEWADKLKALRTADPKGYRYLATIYPEKGHWMEREDASALPWMSAITRDPVPTKIVWRKDNQPQSRFYWLGADPTHWQSGAEITVQRSGQTIEVTSSSDDASHLTLLLNDDVVDLDQAVEVKLSSDKTVTQKPNRTIANLHASLSGRFDPTYVYSAVISAELQDSAKD